MYDTQDNDILDDQATEAHRQAYNAAFEELGLSWHWDPVTYACLPAHGRAGLVAYLHKEQAHLLRAYEADFLANAIETAKARCLQVMLGSRRSQGAYTARGADSRLMAPA